MLQIAIFYVSTLIIMIPVPILNLKEKTQLKALSLVFTAKAL